MAAAAGWTMSLILSLSKDIERLWRSLKHEDVYVKGYGEGREAKAGIGEWIYFYNETRLHQAHGYRTPMAVWRQGLIEIEAGRAARSCGHVDNASALLTGPQPQHQEYVITACEKETERQR